MGRAEGLFPTLTTVVSLALAAYLFLFYLWRAFRHWQDEALVPMDRRVPQRKWASLAFAFVLSGYGIHVFHLNGDVPVMLYDFERAFVLGVLVGLFAAIQRVEMRDRHRQNRRLEKEEDLRAGAHRRGRP